jgi:flagellin-like hook-associated protein FlgL
MFNFTNDNPNGVYRLTGADAGFFEINSSGDVISKAPIDYDTRQMYDLDLTFTTDDGRVFTSQIDLEIRDTFAGKSTLQVEEAQSVIVDGALMTSLQTYAAKDGNQGQFELLPQGNHDLFTMASDGTLTSKGELRMADYPVINLAVRYNGVGMADFIEQISITLTPTSYDHSRSQFIAKESGEVVIIPQLNPYLQAYAEADNFAGRFEIVQSPFAVEIDQAFFEIDSTGQLRTTQMIDFESGKTDFEVTVLYHHSSNTKRYTDYLNLNIINDTRDDNNIALEGLDLSTREGAADAAKLLNEVVVRIAASQAKLGAIENRFTHNLDNLSMNILLAEQANGRIIDADYAIESTRLARSQILDQAATNMLVGANQAKQNLLMLLN